MKNRWYISILVIALLALGNVTSKQQTAIPNQEIVLQFTSGEVTSKEAATTVTNVKNRLANAGISNIQVHELPDGRLKISYYSSTGVECIKTLLSQNNDVELETATLSSHHNETPDEEDALDYNLDVYEIQQSIDLSDVDGKLALETKAENDRFFNPNVDTPSVLYHAEYKERIELTMFNFRKGITIVIDKHSYKIPEVRAGPTT